MESEETDTNNTENLDLKPSTSGSVLFPNNNKYSHIRNKINRTNQYQKYRKELDKARRLARKERKQSNAPKKTPHTIESLRIKDETVADSLTEPEQQLVQHDLQSDEFGAYFNQSYEPRVLITYADNPVQKTRNFGRELTRIIPNSVSLYRNRSSVKKIVKNAIEKQFTDVAVINENRREPNGLLIIHLPDGPTAYFKVSNVKITSEMRKSHKNINTFRPEVILNNFTTQLGLSVGRMLGALFHFNPEFVGKRAVTLHNQRDYIFFRHYGYEFDDNGKRAALHELGPRFTLKLRYLQKCLFDSKYGQYEWIVDGHKKFLAKNRRLFHL